MDVKFSLTSTFHADWMWFVEEFYLMSTFHIPRSLDVVCGRVYVISTVRIPHKLDVVRGRVLSHFHIPHSMQML